MVQGSTFEGNPESIRIDARVAGEFASCYGVNLAVSVFGVWVFSAGCEAVHLQSGGLIQSFPRTLIRACPEQNQSFPGTGLLRSLL
jgi:hypothetical protein